MHVQFYILILIEFKIYKVYISTKNAPFSEKNVNIEVVITSKEIIIGTRSKTYLIRIQK